MVKHVSTRTRFALAVVTLVFLGVALGASPPVQAQQDPTAPPPRQILATGAEDSRPTTAREVAGLEDLAQMIDRSTEGLEVVQRADGTLSVDLRGRFMSLAIARPQADGSEPVSCLIGSEALAALEAFTAQPAKPVISPAAPVEKALSSQLEDR